MYEWLMSIPVVWVALIVGLVCLLGTSLGAASVLFCKNLGKKWVSALLAFAGGIMLASSFFSLILPALEFCGGVMWKEVVFVVLGFLAGAMFIVLTNIAFDKKFAARTGEKNQRRRTMMIVSSITLHNIPEGMAIGVAVGGAIAAGSVVLLVVAVVLAIGIAIQNVPEGASVALSLRCEGVSPRKSFWAGVASGVVEPIFAALASLLTMLVAGVLPVFLAFSAGAMMLVAITELIPESLEDSKLLSVIFLALGFTLMALLDIVL